MQLEFRHGGMVVRVDGDVVEIFGAQGFSHRYLLPALRVEVQPGSGKRTRLCMTCRSVSSHGGSSAAAPIRSGIPALV